MTTWPFRGRCSWHWLALVIVVTLPVTAFADTTVAPPRCGVLQMLGEDGLPVADCPLKHTDVVVDISGFIARVTLTQQFHNPTNEPIEAVYAFPMSDRAAVDSMRMKIGDRTVTGVIKERGEAQRIYEAARNAGQAASLLNQERPNIFTQSVANILPGDNVDITISYVEYLKYEAGDYEFSFPMVVGPRYIPANVPDASKITPPVTPKGTRAGHDIGLTVNLDAGVPVHAVDSELHAVDVQRKGDSEAVVRLKNQKEIPNRDFVLRYAVAGDRIGDAVLTHAGDAGNFFTLILQPPARVAPEHVTPKEMIFVIDKSGSMSGFPIEKAKATMAQCIEGMNPDDTFNLVTFAGGLGYCFERSVPNNKENRAKALAYLANLEGGGGTEMMNAINAALGGQHDPERLRVVCFMTDGFIGNDMAVLDAIQQSVASARVFAFGIGNSVNRFLIENMARVGRGAAEIVTLESDGDEAVERFHSRIQSPLLTDISVDFGGLEVADVYPDPKTIPDLFSAQPLIIKGRYVAAGEGTIKLRGRTATGPYEKSIAVALPKTDPAHDVLAPLWARTRIAAIMDEDWLGAQTGNPRPDVQSAITDLGLQFNLVTQYTSFVAVEDRVINEGGRPRTIQVPVEMPDGVSYEGVFGEGDDAVMIASAAPGSVAVGASVAEAMPAPQRIRPESRDVGDAPLHKGTAPEPKVEIVEQETLAKLDPALQGLAAKVADGRFDGGKVKVRDGQIEVFVFVSDLSETNLAELVALGAKTLNVAHSSGMVRIRVDVGLLEQLAALDFVTKITPPTFN